MSEKKFDMAEAISYGWETMKKNFGFFFLVMFMMLFINYLPGIIAELSKQSRPIFAAVLNIGSSLVSMIISMGFIRMALRIHDSQQTEIGDLFSCAHLLLKFFLGSILYMLVVVGGFILLIVPGIIWAVKYQFFTYLIVDKGLGPIAALKKSAELTAGTKGDLLLFNLLCSLIIIAGFLTLIIGLFAAIPLQAMAVTYVYRKLESQS